MSILAIGWEPELRGILTVIIVVTVLCGGTYLVLATNIGARLGFLVTFASLAGWFFVMGAIWWSYGIGLKGPEPTWNSIPGRTVLQDSTALNQSGALDIPIVVDESLSYTQQALALQDQFVAEGWTQLPDSAPTFGQAGSSAAGFLEGTGAFAAGEFKVVNVFDKGGERYPKLGDKLDFLAFWHKPHYVMVQVAPLLQQRSEPGRAPAAPRIDEGRPHQYVYMIRDLGAKREPAAFITGGSLMLFLSCCWLLHRRDKRVMLNRSQAALPAKA